MKRRIQENIDGKEQVKMVSLKDTFDDIKGLMDDFFESSDEFIGKIKDGETAQNILEQEGLFEQVGKQFIMTTDRKTLDVFLDERRAVENEVSNTERRLKLVKGSVEEFRQLDIWNRLTEDEQRIINDIEIAVDLSDNESDDWKLPNVPVGCNLSEIEGDKWSVYPYPNKRDETMNEDAKRFENKWQYETMFNHFSNTTQYIPLEDESFYTFTFQDKQYTSGGVRDLWEQVMDDVTQIDSMELAEILSELES